MSLRVAIDALSTPADLLSDEQVIDAAHARGLVEELAEGLTDDALLGILARRGKWVLETTPPPSEPQRIPNGFFSYNIDGPEFHATAEEARAEALRMLGEERDDCIRDGFWSDYTGHVCWGEVRERATERIIDDHNSEYDLKPVNPTQTENR